MRLRSLVHLTYYDCYPIKNDKSVTETNRENVSRYMEESVMYKPKRKAWNPPYPVHGLPAD